MSALPGKLKLNNINNNNNNSNTVNNKPPTNNSTDAATKFLANSTINNNASNTTKSTTTSSNTGLRPHTKLTKASAGNKATISELKESVQKQGGFARMIGYSLECFKKLAVSEVAVEEILDEGALEVMYEAVMKHPQNDKLMKQFMDMIATFAKNERLAKMIADRLPNFKFMADSLRNHQDPETHISTCNAINKLAQYEPNIERMRKDGVMDALNDCITRYPNNVQLLSAAAKALNCFANSKDSIDRILKSGSVPVLISIMNNNPDNLELAQNVSKLIASLANGGPDAIQELRRMGAVDALLAAIEFHPYNQELLDSVTAALKLLTGANDMSLALSVVHGNMAIDGKCAAALNKIAGLLLVPDNIDYMFKHKGIEWLISILANANKSTDPHAPKVLATGCRALMRAAADENKIYEIIKHKGVPLLISIINDHMDQPKIVEAALACLGKLVGDRAENAMYLIKHKAIPTCFAAIQNHKRNPEVVKPAVDLLNNLARFEDTHDPLILGGAIPKLCGVIKDFQDTNKPLATLALNTLGMLATSEQNVKSMADAGLGKLLCDLLKNNHDDLELAKAALLGLETLAMLPDYAPNLLKLGSVDAINGCLMNFSDDLELQDIGKRLLPQLLQEAQLAQQAAKRKQQEEEAARLAAAEKARLEKEMADALEQMLEAEKIEAARLKKQKEEEEEKQRLAAIAAEKERKERAWHEEQRQKRMLEDAEKARLAAEKKKEEDKIKTIQMPTAPVKQPIVMTKSARAIFADEDGKKGEFELSDETKNFLWAGQLLTKHSKTAAPRQRHIYMSMDCKFINWKDPKAPLIPKNRMQVFKLTAVIKGCTTQQLQRKTLLGKPMADQSKAFSLCGNDEETENERTVDLEAANEHERERWLKALGEVIEWAKAKKLYGNKTMKVSEDNEIYAKNKAQHVVV